MKIENSIFYPSESFEDIQIAERLIKAYNNTINQDLGVFKTTEGIDDLWSVISEHPQIYKLRELLEQNNPLNLSKYLNDFGKEPMWYGGIHLCGLDPLHPFPLGYDYVCKEILRLSTSIGLDVYTNDTVDNLIIRLSNYFNFNIVPPPVIPISGLKSTSGIIHERHVNSLYFANLIKKYTTPFDNICEYGGGLGLNAFFLYNMNRLNVYLFDLPFVNVISGYFLIKALGNDAVVLEGEQSKRDCIHINAFWNCNKYSENYFEVTANQDSFPEIDIDILKIYFSIIEHNTKSYFLSINQEHESPMFSSSKMHSSVPKIASWFSKLENILRKPYCLRTENNYIEEHYKIN